MEWILDDWYAGDIVSSIVNKWGISERQAKRYISEAREKWNLDEEKVIEKKRRQKIESLKKLKRSLKDSFKGTPAGIKAIMSVEKEIIKLENLAPATKIKIGGDPENTTPIKTTVESNVDYTLLPMEVLQAIVAARKKPTI